MNETIPFFRELKFIESHQDTLESPEQIAQIRSDIQQGDVYIAKKVFPEELILQIRNYLTSIGKGSLPNYQAVEYKCPNFHRVSQWDPRTYVKGGMHQFSFFPWNQDVFNFFEIFKPVYQLKNLLSGLKADQYLGMEPENGCSARLSFHLYPQGTGGLNRHQDPVDYHQLTVPIMIMSQKGEDFKDGGVFVERSNGEQVVLDDHASLGDIVYFNAQAIHGVKAIDPELKTSWLDFKGRWMLLFAVNKLVGNEEIENARDLDDSLI